MSLLAAVALALAGCGGGAGAPSPEPDPPAPGGEIVISAPASTPADPLGEAALDLPGRAEREAKVLDDAEALGPLLNRFWDDELLRVYGLAFDRVERFEYYYGGSGESRCGGGLPLPDNAYYCFSDPEEHAAFDLAWLEQFLVAHPGGATTFLILAHEWGHAVQDTWLEQGGPDWWRPAYRQELSADCLAGVFLAGSIRDGMIVEESGDEDAIFSWLYERGSHASPWLDPGDHGTSEQRQRAFGDGFVRGTDFCRTTY